MNHFRKSVLCKCCYKPTNVFTVQTICLYCASHIIDFFEELDPVELEDAFKFARENQGIEERIKNERH